MEEEKRIEEEMRKEKRQEILEETRTGLRHTEDEDDTDTQ